MINIYPTTFDNKDAIIEYLDKYNEGKDKDNQVVYTDLADTIMSMTDGIMTGITVVLIAFAGISRGAFYMYFQNKEDIFVYIISGYAGELAFNVVKGTNKEKNNIFDFSLMIFDYLTNDKMEKESKEIVGLILTKIDINLINHFINFQNDEVKLELINKYINTDNLNFNDNKELIYISDIVFSSLVSEMLFVFLGKNNASLGRENLRNKLKFIKNGVLKK